MGRFPSPPRGSMPGQQPPWERRGTDEPRGPDREVGVRLPSVGSFGRSAARRAAGRRRLRSEPLLSSRCLGDGEPREGGSSRECVPPPLHPSRGTALKSCGVCHRPAPARMRIGQLEVFLLSFHPLPSLFPAAFGSATLKKKSFFPLGDRREGGSASGSRPRGPGAGGGPRSLRRAGPSAGRRAVWPPLQRPGAASAARSPGSARPLPRELLPPPPPPALAGADRGGARPGAQELHGGRGALASPPPSPAPALPSLASPCARERRGRRGTNPERGRRGRGGGSQCLPRGARPSLCSPAAGRDVRGLLPNFGPLFCRTLK